MTSTRMDSTIADADGLVAELTAAIRSLPDKWLERPSRLPGWTKGHLLAHLVLMGDGVIRLLEGVEAQSPAKMYISAQAREADIELHAKQSASELADGLSSGWERVRAKVTSMPGETVDPVTLFSGRTLPWPELPDVVVAEYRMHWVDLDIGYEPDAWPNAFASDLHARAAGRWVNESAIAATELYCLTCGPSGVIGQGAPGLQLTGSCQQLAAWLTGRSSGMSMGRIPREQLPALPAWA